MLSLRHSVYLIIQNVAFGFFLLRTDCNILQVFHLVSFEAMYKLKIPKMVNDIVFPQYNVATLEKSACVIEGVRYRFLYFTGEQSEFECIFQSFTQYAFEW